MKAITEGLRDFFRPEPMPSDKARHFVLPLAFLLFISFCFSIFDYKARGVVYGALGNGISFLFLCALRWGIMGLMDEYEIRHERNSMEIAILGVISMVWVFLCLILAS